MDFEGGSQIYFILKMEFSSAFYVVRQYCSIQGPSTHAPFAPFKSFRNAVRNEKRNRRENNVTPNATGGHTAVSFFSTRFKVSSLLYGSRPYRRPRSGRENEGGVGMEMLFFLLAGCILGLLSG